MTRAAILALLGVGAIAASAIVYFTWLEPDDRPLFAVDAPEPPSAEPPGQATQPGPPEDRDEPRRPRRRRGPGGPTGAVPGGEAIQQFTGLIPPGGGGAGPAGPQQQPPQQPDQQQEPDQEPTDDQYDDSLSRLLSRLDGG